MAPVDSARAVFSASPRSVRSVSMAFPFSSRTIGVLVDSLSQGYSHADLGTACLRAEADRWDPGDGVSKQVRAQRLFAAMRAEGGKGGEKAALALAESVARAGSPGWGEPARWWQETIDALAADGWEYDANGDRLVASVPGVEIAEETSLLEAGLIELGWRTAAGHYREALESCASGRWAASNSQLRSFLEELLPKVAGELTGGEPRNPVAALQAAAKANELVEGEFDFARGLWAMCQPRGSHPGLSDEEEARFRLIVATAYCRFLLARLHDV